MILFYFYARQVHTNWSPLEFLLSSITFRVHTVIILEYVLLIHLLISFYSQLNLFIKWLYSEQNSQKFPKMLTTVHLIRVESSGSYRDNIENKTIKIERDTIIEGLEKIQEMYTQVYQTCDLMSSRYGTRIFLIVARTICLLTSVITEFTFSLIRQEVQDPVLQLMHIFCIGFSAYSLVLLSNLIMKAIRMKDIGGETPLLLYKLANKYKRDEVIQRRIELLVHYIWTHELEFSTNGLLDLDFKLILMVGT
ncbi:hypothetical protein WDU94_013118 [Cyamophila willieti]